MALSTHPSLVVISGRLRNTERAKDRSPYVFGDADELDAELLELSYQLHRVAERAAEAVVLGHDHWSCTGLVGVGPRRSSGLPTGPFSRPALRTGRAAPTASGSPQAHVVGLEIGRAAHGVASMTWRK